MGQEPSSAELERILTQMREQPTKIAPSDRRAKFTNKERIREQLGASGLAAIIVMAPENVPYFSGYFNADIVAASRENPNIIVWPVQGEPVYICRALKPGQQNIDPFIRDIRVYARWTSPMKHLADVITERGWSKSQLGIEKNFFPVGNFEELIGLVGPGVKFVDCRNLISEIKMVKTPAEIQLLRFAARTTEKAIRITYEMTRPGDTEKSVADMLGYAITRLGADKPGSNIVASAERTVQGHHTAEDVILKVGDLFRVDYGGIFSGYLTDMARTAVVGQSSENQRSIYEKIWIIHQAMLAGIHPGAIPHQLVAKALKQYDDAGMPPNRSFFGHGIGLSVHEEPSIRINNQHPLEQNMILCIENGWSDESIPERYHIEDMILVTERGFELLTNYAPTDQLFVMG